MVNADDAGHFDWLRLCYTQHLGDRGGTCRLVARDRRKYISHGTGRRTGIFGRSSYIRLGGQEKEKEKGLEKQV